MTNKTAFEISQEITDKGGIRSAELINELFGEDNSFFHGDNDFSKFFEDIWNTLTELWNSSDSSRSLKGDISEIGGGINIFPSLKSNGYCSDLSLTLVPMGFYKIAMGDMLTGGRNRINFYKAALLLSEYWFKCLPINRENLILVGNWNLDYFNFFRPTIESYAAYGKRVFIVEVSASGFILQYSI